MDSDVRSVRPVVRELLNTREIGIILITKSIADRS